MENIFAGIYNGKKVFLTGHSGFKGSWLANWLEKLGADVLGYSISVPTQPAHFEVLKLGSKTVFGDINDYNSLEKVMSEFKPDIVFHLAAQPLVRDSYFDPISTLETNIIGAAKVFEAAKKISSVKAIVNVTSDKCYDNKEWVWGYREDEAMGGYDPYSCSKGCAELVTASYRKSFFNNDHYGEKHNTLLASCRAGNVIGGGDWAKDRLIPDYVKAADQKEAVEIRSPKAVRPWQHVLEPLSGYLLVGQKLLEGKKEFADAWNFGPSDDGVCCVQEVLDRSKKYWDKLEYRIAENYDLHEAHLLSLDCTKAKALLKWTATWDNEETFRRTIEWYKSYYELGQVDTEKDLELYVKAAKEKGLEWAHG